MSNTRTRLRRAVSGGAAAVTVGATVLAFAPTASATLDASATRIAGTDRYGTAAAVAEKAYASSTTAILADGEPGHFPDALAGNYLAGQINAPILLTRLASTPQVTLDALKTLGVKNLYLLGGTGAISAAQEQALKDAGFTITARLGGADRWGTDKAVSEAPSQAVGTIGGKKTAIVAYGLNFPDALAAGSLSFSQHFPIVITKSDHLTPEAKATLSDLGIGQVIISGGTSVVTAGVESDLSAMGISVLFRANGANRADTSAQLAQWEFDNIGNWDKTGIGVASGYATGDGADALAGGVWTGLKNQSMLVTFSNTSAGAALTSWVTKNSSTIKNITIFGGTGAVSTSVENAIVAAAKAVPSKNIFTVSPSTAQSVDTGKSVTFTVTGIKSTTVDIALARCSNVTNNGATFADTENSGAGDNQADLTGTTTGGSTSATLGTVNGANNGTQYADSVAVVNGAVQFTVTDTVPECAVAVVFDDANNNNALDLDANNAPTENYGVTPNVTFNPPAATSSNAGGTVTSNDEANDSFVACTTAPSTGCFTYKYDSNDTFYNGGFAPANQITMAQFEQMLNAGDTVGTSYNPNPALSSAFVLNDQAPQSPTGVATSNATNSSVKVTWNAVPNADSYNIYRLTGACPTTVDLTKFTKVGNVAASTSPLAFTDTALAKGTTYCYTVTTLEQGQESSDVPGTTQSTASATTTNTTPDTTPPTLTNAAVTSDTGLVGVATTGDVWTLTFSEQMNTSTATGTFRVQDTDGTIVDVICNGTSATCVLGNTDANGNTVGTNRVLTITLGTLGTPAAAGSNPGLQYPATLTNVSASVQDLAGNTLNVSGSPDKTIN